MESNPRSLEHTYPYTNLIFAVGRLEETVRIIDELQGDRAAGDVLVARPAVEPHRAAPLRRCRGRIPSAARPLVGSHHQPEYIRFLRLLSREDTDPQALREPVSTVAVTVRMKISHVTSRKLAPVLGDRPRMLEVLRKEFAAEPSAAACDGRRRPRGRGPCLGLLARQVERSQARVLRRTRSLWIVALLCVAHVARIQGADSRNGPGGLLAPDRRLGRCLQASRRRRLRMQLARAAALSPARQRATHPPDSLSCSAFLAFALFLAAMRSRIAAIVAR